jgi:hypothetical protein
MATYVFKQDEPLPPKVAKALEEFYSKYGEPPYVTESIEVKVENGGVVDIKFFSVKEME